MHHLKYSSQISEYLIDNGASDIAIIYQNNTYGKDMAQGAELLLALRGNEMGWDWMT